MNQPTITGVALRQKSLDTHCLDHCFPNYKYVPQNTGVRRDVNSCDVTKSREKKNIDFLKNLNLASNVYWTVHHCNS